MTLLVENIFVSFGITISCINLGVKNIFRSLEAALYSNEKRGSNRRESNQNGRGRVTRIRRNNIKRQTINCFTGKLVFDRD